MKRKLKVIQLLPALNSGGVERGTTEIARALVNSGHESYVISAGGRLVAQLENEGSHHITLPIGEKRLSTLKYIWQLRKIMKDIKPDIIHLRSRLPAWIAFLAWRKLPVKSRPHIITTVHGPYSVNRYSAIMTAGERVIAVSNMIKTYISDNYPKVDIDKVEVIHRGVDTEQYHPNYTPSTEWKEKWLADYPQLKNTLVLTLPARITAWKGQHDFIRCIEKLVKRNINVQGVIVGETHPRKQGFLAELQQTIAERNLANHITFTGHRSDIQNILSVSDIVFSLAKEPEAFGRTTIEALSMNIPVIGYNHGGVAEQLEAMLPEGLIDVDNIDAAVEKVITWQQSPPIIQQSHPFKLKNMCEKTLMIYQSVTEEK